MTAVAGAPLRVGTSGWGYRSWQPGFYPAGLAADAFLAHYAGVLPAVELNSTAYRLPAAEQFRRWAVQTPLGFRFAVKAPPRVERRLDEFQERVLALGERLGCVRLVVETPRDDGLVELVLGSADPRVRWAFDLRHPSWDGIEERLAASGAVRVDDERGAAGWTYVRFREESWSADEIATIGDRLVALAERGLETFAFFRHGDAPDAPSAALAVLAVLAGRTSATRS
ncbi:MAG: DUF72 domain-containing protein [Gaiella sp.]